MIELGPVRVVVFVAAVVGACIALWPSSASAPVPSSLPVAATPRAHGATATGARDPSAVAAPSERARLEGQVVDEREAPIAGARVRIGARETRSEGDGSFAFDGVSVGPLVVIAEAGEHYGEVHTTFAADDEPLEVKVRRGWTLDLRLQHADLPVRGATVEIAERSYTTGDDGRVVIRGLDPVGERLRVHASGLATRSEHVELDADSPTATQVLVLQLASGAALGGVVVDEHGTPVPDALVSVAGDSFESVFSDAQGRWTADALGPDTYRITATSDVHVATAPLVVEHTGELPRTNLAVHVARGAVIAGRVVDRDGHPLEGADIHGAAHGARSDADGRFVATGLEPGTVTLLALTATHASQPRAVTVAAGARVEVTLVMTAASLAGRVVDRAGQPIEDASVFAASVADDSDQYYATTDASGAFDLGGVPPGDYRIVAQRPEEQRRSVPAERLLVHSGDRAIRLELDELATVAGRVVVDGAPVPYYGVAITKTPEEHFGQASETVRDRDGRFAQSAIAPGTWSVVITGPGFLTRTLRGVVVAAGETTDLGTIAVERGRVVRGHVTDERGRPLAGADVIVGTRVAWVAADRIDQRTMGDASTRSDAAGAYELAGLTADADLRIVARTVDGTSLETALAPAATVVDLVIVDGGVIAGRIVNDDGNQVTVTATSVADRDRAYDAKVDASGRYTIRNVPPGSYEVDVTGKNTLATEHASVVAHRTTRIDFVLPATPITVEVHRRGCDDLIWLYAAEQLRAFEVCTASDHDVARFAAVAPGPYRLCLDDGRCTEITVAAAPATQLFELPPR